MCDMSSLYLLSHKVVMAVDYDYQSPEAAASGQQQK